MSSTVLLSFLPGLSLSLKLRLVGSQALAETVTLTESGTQAGEYSGTTALTDSDLAVGIFSGASKVGDDFLTVAADAGTYRVGVPAPAELDSTALDPILAALSGVSVIQVASPNVKGNLVLTQGDSYDGIANPKAAWTVTTDYTDGWSVILTIRDSADSIVYSTSGTVASTTSITVAIDAPTGLAMIGCPGQWQGKFDVQLTKAGSIKTIALGVCYINEDQTR